MSRHRIGGRRGRVLVAGAAALAVGLVLAGWQPAMAQVSAASVRHHHRHPRPPATAAPSPSASSPAAVPQQPPPPPPATSSSSPSGSTAPAGVAYQVRDGKLFDPCGNQVVLRGVNKMAEYADPNGDSFPEIAKTGANTVRFMWQTDKTAAQAATLLQRAVDSQLIPIWELHDATGDFSKLPQIEAYWTRPDTIAVLKRFESHLVVNIANEAGTNVSDADFVSTYNRIIGKFRGAGLRMPLMVDAAGFGRDVEQLLVLAPGILSADPLHNVIFSWHVYDSGSEQPARIDRAMATSLTQKILLVIGEFGPVSPGACQLSVPFQHLISQAQAAGIGYLPWSWDNFNGDCNTGGGSAFDMVGDAIHLSTLKPGYATVVVVSDPASIQHTAKRTPWQTGGRCA